MGIGFVICRQNIAIFSPIPIIIPPKVDELSHYGQSKSCNVFSNRRYFSQSYGDAYHPRFGDIRCCYALRDIGKGEEITCDYKYSMSKQVPEWYLHSLRKHLQQLRVTDAQIESAMEKMKNE